MPKRLSTTTLPSGHDALFEAVSRAHMRGERVTTNLLPAAARLAFAPAAACFHHVEGPACTLHIDGSRRITLHDGDLVLLPQGRPHRIERGPGEAAPTRLTTGDFQADSASADLIARALPPVMQVPRLAPPREAPPESAEQWLAVTLGAMRREAEHPSPGSDLMLSRLIDLLFVWIVRHWLASAPSQPRGWIAALQDPLVGKALALMQAEPARDWDVDALARHFNQSRSVFSQRFVELVGEPPIRHLTRWRMYIAADLLASPGLRISQIAKRVGYDSEPAFTRAFKRELGIVPSQYRLMVRRR